VKEHVESGIAFHSMLQMDDGHFPGDYGGPMFLMPGMLISCYVTGVLNTVFTPQHKSEMIRYIKNHQNEDGGFGLHIEGHSTMFGTGLRSALPPALFPDKQNHSNAAFLAIACLLRAPRN
jgi:prenyltransferase beta subunit